jgi:hypothetical protein
VPTKPSSLSTSADDESPVNLNGSSLSGELSSVDVEAVFDGQVTSL